MSSAACNAHWTMAEERKAAEETALRLLQAALQRGLQTEEAQAASGLGRIIAYEPRVGADTPTGSGDVLDLLMSEGPNPELPGLFDSAMLVNIGAPRPIGTSSPAVVSGTLHAVPEGDTAGLITVHAPTTPPRHGSGVATLARPPNPVRIEEESSGEHSSPTSPSDKADHLLSNLGSHSVREGVLPSETSSSPRGPFSEAGSRLGASSLGPAVLKLLDAMVNKLTEVGVVLSSTRSSRGTTVASVDEADDEGDKNKKPKERKLRKFPASDPRQ